MALRPGVHGVSWDAELCMELYACKETHTGLRTHSTLACTASAAAVLEPDLYGTVSGAHAVLHVPAVDHSRAKQASALTHSSDFQVFG